MCSVLHAAFALESSALSFPDLCRLVAFYCISRDVLPFPLELPEAIAQATNHTQLETISHLGLEFWSSQASPGPPNGPPAVSVRRTSRTGSPCFINPLFLQPPPPSRGASHKRHRFKRSLRVRVSTESSFSPSAPPPPLHMPVQEMIQDEGVCLALERRRAPSLAELDSSSSFSSLEEEDSQLDASLQWPPAARGSRFPVANPASTLRRMSAAFVCVFAPERRVAWLVDELSRDRRSVFGSLVQDFLEKQKEELKTPSWSSAVQLLQGVRRFLSQAKNLLLEAGELEPPIETLVPENEKERLGVRSGVLDAQGIERAKKKLTLMQRSHSPIDKVLLLLQVCKSVYKAMGSQPGECVSEDFLPVLSYVVVQCNIPQLMLETEYMMELLEPSWLTGEGSNQETTQSKVQKVMQKLRSKTQKVEKNM
uniref:Ras and Rab interactor 2 n=1 Tax=Astyanax mexicanus TaxID=7994 RepID=A0A8B9GS90_ASTMX